MSPLVLLPRLRPVLSKRMGLALGLWGEAGIGKTWTAGQLITQTPCRSFTLNATASLAVWVKTLPRPNKLPVWVLRICERVERGEHLDSAPLADALAGLLAAMAPVMLRLEDLHEVSAERMELITFLAQRVARTKGVALIVTSRRPPPEPFEAVRLEALSPEDSRQLLEAEVGAQLPIEGLDWIYTHALGNPLFTLEYVRYLIRMGHLWSDGQRWHWRTPPQDLMPLTIEALIEQMLVAIGDENLRAALEARAILPAQISEALWAQVAQLEAGKLEQAKLGLLQQGILHGSSFAHPLIKEVAGKNLQPQQRQTLARRALEALRHDPETAALFVADAALLPGQALEVLKQAAESAKERGNEVQAARFLAQATEYAHGKEQSALALEAAQGLRQVDLPGAKRLAELAHEAKPDNPETIYLLAELLARQGLRDEMNGVLERLPEQHRGVSSRAAWSLKLYTQLSDYAAAISLVHTHPELCFSDDPDVAHFAARALLEAGEMDQANAVISRALAQGHLTPTQVANLINVQALVAFYQGDCQTAITLFGKMLHTLQGNTSSSQIAVAHYNRSLARNRLADVRGAIEDLQTARQLCLVLGDVRRYAHTQAVMGKLLKEQGEYAKAEQALLESLGILEKLAPSSALLDCERILSELYETWQPPYGPILTLKYAHSALAHARLLQSPAKVAQGLFHAAIAEAKFGDSQQGLVLSEEMLGLAQSSGQSELLFFAYIARAFALEAIAGVEEARVAFKEALSWTKDPLDIEFTQLELDRLNHNIEGAHKRMEWFRERGLINGVNIALRYFPELAQTPTAASSEPLQLPTLDTGTSGSRLEAPRGSGSRLEAPGDSGSRLEAPGDSGSRLEVLGPFRFGGQAIRGQKRKELLAALLEARLSGRSEAPSLNLIERLYPEVPELEAQALLRNLVFSTRESLGQAVIVTTSAGYALGEVDSDAEEFLHSGDTLLWRGTYRSDAEGDADQGVWEALYHSLANQSAGLMESDPTEAARIGRILLEADPYNPEHLGLTLKALRASNNHKSLTRLYTQARERFLEVGQTLPESWKTYLQESA